MERKLASIQRVTSLTPIEGADRIELAKVMGWQCIVAKGDFQPNDLCVFFEVDSLLPECPEFAFMKKHHYRVRTMKMRGMLSQGLAMPLSVFELSNLEEGIDVTALLKVQKWEAPAHFVAGQPAGLFPFYIPKTDEIRLQSALGVLDEMKGLRATATVKVDGTSATFSHRDGEFHVCSRNFSITDGQDSLYWKIQREYGIFDLLKTMGNVAIQGEICGPGIQKNRLGLSKPKLFVFDVYNSDTRQYLSRIDWENTVKSHGLDVVPIAFFVVNWDEFTLERLLERAKGTYESSGQLREGIVIRPNEETYSPTLKGRLSFKVLNNDFLLKE